MKYINTMNGAEIETSSILGGVWEAKNASHTKPVENVEKGEEAPKKTTKRSK